MVRVTNGSEGSGESALVATVSAMLAGLLAQSGSDLRPGFTPAIVTSDVAQGKHGIDRGARPVHTTAFETSFHDKFVGTLDCTIADRPPLLLKGGIVHVSDTLF